MRLYKTTSGAVLERADAYYWAPVSDWDAFVNRDDLRSFLESLIPTLSPVTGDDWRSDVQAPIKSQEIWAAGVTYWRSRDARMEESKAAGGATFYDKVYEADRPEIFFKATASRTAGPHGTVHIRSDSTWDVPEPELALFVTSNARIVAYTIGNDMSSRSIEGENPLYLPQAKTYDGCAALGPCLYVPNGPIDPNTEIRLFIERRGERVFSGQVGIQQMRRAHTELVGYLFYANTFPQGCFLMTGTGIVPAPPFTLAEGDQVRIEIDGIGALENVVKRWRHDIFSP